jgi:predicted nucleic acid-binding protein
MHRGTIGINPIVYAELAPAYSSVEALDRMLADLAGGSTLQRWPLPWEAAYRAGRAFLRYRRQHRGSKRSPLPDFFIGAHAEIDDLVLLTRDERRYRTYFPAVELIAP